jgi:undecaprenyl-diphosphatase
MNLNSFYDLFVAIIIGAVEGFTEFLPISSTAHNSLASNLLLNGKDLGLDVSNIFQFGALVAIVQYFWHDIKGYLQRLKEIIIDSKCRNEFLGNIKNWNNNKIEQSEITIKTLENKDHNATLAKSRDNIDNDLMLVQLVLATVPAAVIGFLMRGVLDGLRTYIWIGFFLIIGSMLMGISDWYYSKTSHKDVTFLSRLQVFNIGLFQTLGIFPGISRSGATVAGTFFLGIEREKAVRFAFLLGIPILALAGIYDGIKVILKIFKEVNYPILYNPNVLMDGKISALGIVLGAVVSYFVALASLKWLLKYLSNNRFTPFIVYRVLLGLFLILSSLIGYK